MHEQNVQEIDDILNNLDAMYDLTAQQIAAKLRISSVHLSRVRHGEYGEKATQSLLAKLRSLAESYGMYEEPDPQIEQEQKAQFQLARAMERDAYHPALIQASYRRFGLDSTALSWASLFMGQDRLNDLVVQLATRQFVTSQYQRQTSRAKMFAQRKPAYQLSQPRTRERIHTPSQPLLIEAPRQQQQDQERVIVTEVNQQEVLQSFYGELLEHRK